MFNMNPAKYNLDEVVFANRNQAYGAYAIRKQYSANVNRSLFIVLSALVLLPLFGYFKPSHVSKPTILSKESKDEVVRILDIILEPIQQATSSATSSTTASATTDNGNYRIAPDQQITKPTLTATQVITNPSPTTSTIGTGSPINKMNSLGTLPGPITTPILPAKSAVRDVADVMPVFNDGDLYEYLQKKMNYPELARKINKEGKVVVVFEVDELGNVRNVQIEKSLGFGCDDEAIRVISGMPKWKPAMSNGEAVPVRVRLPIAFKLN
jgi:protein TonB